MNNSIWTWSYLNKLRQQLEASIKIKKEHQDQDEERIERKMSRTSKERKRW